MDLLPAQYNFSGIEIRCIFVLQRKIKDRILAIEGENKDDKATSARLEELGLLDLAMDRHISQTVRRQEEEKLKSDEDNT